MPSSSKEDYSGVTDSIIKLMEDGTFFTGQGWESDVHHLPFNFTTDEMYRGINIINLWVTQMTKGYQSMGWMTLRQARNIGAKLKVLPANAPDRGDSKTGQKGTAVFKAGDGWIPSEWKIVTGSEDLYRSQKTGDYEEGDNLRRSYLKRVGTLFNLDQFDNLPIEPREANHKPLPETEINNLLDNHPVPVFVSQNGRCYYDPRKDNIYMVHENDFTDHNTYLLTLFHELTHSTGHKSRLDRFPPKIDKTYYAKEELIAELGAAFLGARFGIPGGMVHAHYLQHYIAHLKEDDRAIFKAAAAAQTAVELLLEQQQHREEAA